MDQKPGVETTEFWLTVALVISGALVGLGIIKPEQSEAMKGDLSILLPILAAAGVAAYTFCRTWLKRK